MIALERKSTYEAVATGPIQLQHQAAVSPRLYRQSVNQKFRIALPDRSTPLRPSSSGLRPAGKWKLKTIDLFAVARCEIHIAVPASSFHHRSSPALAGPSIAALTSRESGDANHLFIPFNLIYYKHPTTYAYRLSPIHFQYCLSASPTQTAKPHSRRAQRGAKSSAHHAASRRGAKSTLSGCCSRRAYGRLRAACRRKSGAAGLAEYLPFHMSAIMFRSPCTRFASR